MSQERDPNDIATLISFEFWFLSELGGSGVLNKVEFRSLGSDDRCSFVERDSDGIIVDEGIVRDLGSELLWQSEVNSANNRVLNRRSNQLAYAWTTTDKKRSGAIVRPDE